MQAVLLDRLEQLWSYVLVLHVLLVSDSTRKQLIDPRLISFIVLRSVASRRHKVLLEYVLICSLEDMLLVIDEGFDLRLHELANIGLSTILDFVFKALIYDLLHLVQVFYLLSAGLLERGLCLCKRLSHGLPLGSRR